MPRLNEPIPPAEYYSIGATTSDTGNLDRLYDEFWYYMPPKYLDLSPCTS
jgi:hypothetical protein